MQSVPPVWKVVQSIWAWMEINLVDEQFDEASPIGTRRAWWEEMVEYLIETEGFVSLT
jgi:hypothetical protein